MDEPRRADGPRAFVAAVQPLATNRFPTLAFIDRARGDMCSPFAEASNAPDLERCARALTARYWSDAVWTTGLVSAVAFNRVCDELEREVTAAAEPATRSEDVRSAAA